MEQEVAHALPSADAQSEETVLFLEDIRAGGYGSVLSVWGDRAGAMKALQDRIAALDSNDSVAQRSWNGPRNQCDITFQPHMTTVTYRTSECE